MDELAAEAGVTKPVLYTHFGDKAGVADALAERFAGEIGVRLLAVLTRDEHRRSVLRDMVDAFLAFVERDPAIYRFVLQRSLGRPELPQRRVFDELGRQVSAVVELTLRREDRDPRPAAAWSYSLLGSMLAVAEWWLDHPETARDVLVDDITELFWAGLRGARRPAATA